MNKNDLTQSVLSKQNNKPESYPAMAIRCVNWTFLLPTGKAPAAK